MRLTKILLAGAMILSLGACKKYDGEKSARQREGWIESLNDSIADISSRRASDSARIEQLREDIATRISDFATVDNPREVEPYYILKKFRGSYPLQSTGIAARMMKNEQIELVASLRGHRFDAIRVSVGGNTAESDVVPADQALNYTSGGLTTVSFTGAKADSICILVSGNQAASISLSYLQNGVVRQSVTLSDSQKEWIASTWRVCGAEKEIHLLERRMLVDSRKIEILKITMNEKLNGKDSGQEDSQAASAEK